MSDEPLSNGLAIHRRHLRWSLTGLSWKVHQIDGHGELTRAVSTREPQSWCSVVTIDKQECRYLVLTWGLEIL